jgi:23S rRNA (guanosine2251-2'-O)-methyltransferase
MLNRFKFIYRCEHTLVRYKSNNITKSKHRYNEPDSPEYLAKKKFFSQFLTIYGRQAVFDVLENDSLNLHKLHVSTKDRHKGIIPSILEKAREKGIQTKFYDDPKKLVIISKATNEDLTQGVCMDVVAPKIRTTAEYLVENKDSSSETFIALDSVSTPKNVGLIIRTVASVPNFTGLIFPPSKVTALNHPEVVRASTGALFRTTVLRSTDASFKRTLERFIKEKNALIYLLIPPSGKQESNDIYNIKRTEGRTVIYVIGSESKGIDEDIKSLLDVYPQHVSCIFIPMSEGMNSLNAAVCTGVVCYQHYNLYNTAVKK